ncbi:MAG TPA: hypothetical protein VNX66_13160 [Candidatus Sulfotelmatobacter sp.]|jgi:hypothetical protein|nr:hypothetical protein [Candidatus Sulfotelmatobacter sp.]
MIVRMVRSIHFIRVTLFALCVTAAYSPVVASQETKKEVDLRCSSSDATFPCSSTASSKELPDAPAPQTAQLTGVAEAQDHTSPSSPSSIPQDQNGAVLFLPVKSPRTLSFNDKFTIYTHQTFGPPALIFPAFAAGMGMANPKSNYPREWKDGPGAFGRLYGDSIAMATSQRTARFLTGAALHEDPRYVRSTSTNPLARTAHALAFTFIDKTDSGRNTLAFSNFAGAAASGFVGSAYLPHGYNDLTHAEQRMAFQFTSIAIQNIAAEFQPQWGPLVRKLRIQKIIPEWWVPQHKN